MPVGYQHPMFHQFDGKGSPKQNVEHSIETFKNARIYSYFLIKKFFCSPKDNVFDWYTDLESCSINSWEHIEKAFINHFYSTRHTVVEHTNTRQQNKV